MTKRLIAAEGEKYGHLTVLGDAYRDSHGHAYWRCLCDCGKETTVLAHRARSGRTSTCGCHRGNRTHGLSGTPEHVAWKSMLRRCQTVSTTAYQHYGGRGITVCRRWEDSFLAFLEDMGTRPSSNHSLDRIDNMKGYSPDNCRWSSKTEQMNNTRRNAIITIGSEKHTLAEWAKITDQPYARLSQRRCLGWPDDEVIYGRKEK